MADPKSSANAESVDNTEDESDAEVSDGRLRRIAGLWFDDGTVILQAGICLFRVYKGILCSGSSVFRDMFSFPQPDDQEMIDDCPVVHLPDKSLDVYSLLKAIFHPGYVESLNASSSFHCIAGVLRLSTKYDLPYYRALAAARLARAYPPTLHGWDHRAWPFRRKPGTAFAVVALARTAQLPALLPAALYHAATAALPRIFDGHTWRDGTHCALHPADTRTVVLARERLLRAQGARLHAFLRAGADACASAGACDAGRLEWLEENAEEECRVFSAFAWEAYATFVCAACVEAAKEQFEDVREELWDELPAFFELQSWEELRAIDV